MNRKLLLLLELTYNTYVFCFLFTIGNLYLPPFDEVMLGFLADILKGDKKALNKADVIDYYIPHLPELSVDVLLDIAK